MSKVEIKKEIDKIVKSSSKNFNDNGFLKKALPFILAAGVLGIPNAGAGAGVPALKMNNLRTSLHESF